MLGPQTDRSQTNIIFRHPRPKPPLETAAARRRRESTAGRWPRRQGTRGEVTALACRIWRSASGLGGEPLAGSDLGHLGGGVLILDVGGGTLVIISQADG